MAIRHQRLRDKAYICGFCRKPVAYSPDEAGTTRPCPRCGATITLPGKASRKKNGAKRRTAGIVCLLLAALLGGYWFLVLKPQRNAVVPVGEPARVPWVSASVTVVSAAYGPAALVDTVTGRRYVSETPCLQLWTAVKNTGASPIRFTTWRYQTETPDKVCASARLQDGTHLNPFSFGLDAVPVDAYREEEIAPGASVTDVILFLCSGKPDQDIELVLPFENLGGRSGVRRFLIPATAVQGESR